MFFFRTHAQLRKSDTTGFIDIDAKKDINKGIFLDIFVLDNIPNGILRKKLFKIDIMFRKKILAYQYDRNYETLSWKEKAFYTLVHIFFKVYPFKRYYIKFNKVLARYQDKKTALVGDITLKWRSNVQWPKEWFNGYTYLTFEGLDVRVPLFYNEVLTRQYGNFMTIPSDVTAMNGRVHGNVIFAPDTPYKSFFATYEFERQ